MWFPEGLKDNSFNTTLELKFCFYNIVFLLLDFERTTSWLNIVIFWFPEILTYYLCIFLNKLNKSQIADAHLIMCYFWKLSRPSLVFVWEKNPKNFSFSSSYTSSQIIQLHILFFLCLTEQLKQNSNQKSIFQKVGGQIFILISTNHNSVGRVVF